MKSALGNSFTNRPTANERNRLSLFDLSKQESENAASTFYSEDESDWFFRSIDAYPSNYMAPHAKRLLQSRRRGNLSTRKGLFPFS
jgi:hypothetical protein